MDNMQQPQITVVVPVYNAAAFLSRCIDSVISQTFTDWELVLVDDCSTDNSAGIAAGYAGRDSRIRLIRHNENAGPLAARKTAWEKARGTYLTFLDADDTLPADALASLIGCMDEDTDAVFGSYDYVLPDGSVKFYSRCDTTCEHDLDEVQRLALKQVFKIILCAALLRTSLLTAHEYLTDKGMLVGEDRMLFVQLINHCRRIKVLRKSVYNYIQVATSTTQSRMNDNKLRSAMKAYDWVYRYYQERGKFNHEINYFYIRQVNILLESGIRFRQIAEASSLTKQVYAPRNVLRTFGIGGVLHTSMLSHCCLYCLGCRLGRHIIRIVQGKC